MDRKEKQKGRKVKKKIRERIGEKQQRQINYHALYTLLKESITQIKIKMGKK